MIRTRNLLVLILGFSTLLACNLAPGVPSPTPVASPVQSPPAQEESVGPLVATPPGLETTIASDLEEAPSGENAASGTIDIVMVNSYQDNLGTFTVVGLVTNGTSSDVDNVELDVELFDSGGGSIYRETAFLDLLNLAPGETSPFSVEIFEDVSGVSSYDVKIIGSSATDLERAPVEIDNTRMMVDDAGDVHITGELFNNEERPVAINGLAAAVFDSSGGIIAADSYNVTIRYLDPGDSGPFRVTIFGPQSGPGSIEYFKLYLDVELTEPVAPVAVTISEATNYQDSFDALHLVGGVTNDGDIPLSVRLVAGIYNVEGDVLDAAGTDLPLSALAPGETLPFDFEFWGPLNGQTDLVAAADSYSIQVDGYWTGGSETRFVEFAVENDRAEADQFGVQHTGRIVNNSGSPVIGGIILIYLRDMETGGVVAMDFDFIAELIEGEDGVDYTVFLDLAEGVDLDSLETVILARGELP